MSSGNSLGLILYDNTNNFISKVVGDNQGGKLGIDRNPDNSLDLSTNLVKSIKGNPFINYIAFSDDNGGFITKNGQVYLMGSNQNKQLGSRVMNGVNELFVSSSPLLVEDLSNATEIHFGFGNSTFVRTTDGKIWVFGQYSNKYEPGLLRELGHTGIGFDSQPSLYDQFYLTNVTHFAVGSNFCVMYDEMFGFKSMGGADAIESLGQGQFITDSIAPNSLYPSNSTVSKISCGEKHTLILHTDGSVTVFGKNDCGQLGLGNYDTVYDPILNTDLSEVVDIACGKDFSVVVLSTGEAFAFGKGNNGKLGTFFTDPVTPTTPNTNLPIKIPNISNAYAVTCGENFTAILCSDGTVKTFGDNTHGVLGNGTNTNDTLLNSVSYDVDKELNGVMALSNSLRNLSFTIDVSLNIEEKDTYLSTEQTRLSWNSITSRKFDSLELTANRYIDPISLSNDVTEYQLPNLPENFYSFGISPVFSFTKGNISTSRTITTFNTQFLFIHRHFVNLNDLLSSISPFTTYTLIDEWINADEMINAFKIYVIGKPYEHVGILFENYDNSLPFYNNIVIPTQLFLNYEQTSIGDIMAPRLVQNKNISNLFSDLNSIIQLLQTNGNNSTFLNIITGNLGKVYNSSGLNNIPIAEKYIQLLNEELSILNNTNIFWSKDYTSIVNGESVSIIKTNNSIDEKQNSLKLDLRYQIENFRSTYDTFTGTYIKTRASISTITKSISLYTDRILNLIDVLKEMHNNFINIPQSLVIQTVGNSNTYTTAQRFFNILSTPELNFFNKPSIYTTLSKNLLFFKDQSELRKNYILGSNNLEPFISVDNNNSLFCNGRIVTGKSLNVSVNYSLYKNDTIILKYYGKSLSAQLSFNGDYNSHINTSSVNIGNGLHPTDIKHSMISIRGKLGSYSNVAQVSCTPFTTTILLNNGSIREFGFLNGFFVNGNTNETVVYEHAPRVRNSNIVQISTNSFCIDSLNETPKLVSTRLYLGSDGKVTGSGYSGFYQLSDTITTNGNSYYSVYPDILTDIVQVSCGVTHCAFLQEGGNVIFFSGNNEYGQIGWGYSPPYNSPAELVDKHKIYAYTDVSNVVQVECGNRCTYILTSAGDVYQLGDGFIIPDISQNSYDAYKIPFPETDGEKTLITKISCSKSHVLFLTNTGNILGAGMNGRTSNYKPLRQDGTMTDVISPEFLLTPRNDRVSQVIDICALQNRTYFLTIDGNVLLYNTYTQVGSNISHLSSTQRFVDSTELISNFNITHKSYYGKNQTRLEWDFGNYNVFRPLYFIVNGTSDTPTIINGYQSYFEFNSVPDVSYNIEIKSIYPNTQITFPITTVSYRSLTNDELEESIDIKTSSPSGVPFVQFDNIFETVSLSWDFINTSTDYNLEQVIPQSFEISVTKIDVNNNTETYTYNVENNLREIKINNLDFDNTSNYSFEIIPKYINYTITKSFKYKNNIRNTYTFNLTRQNTDLQKFFADYYNIVPVFYYSRIEKFRR